ncbi:unnamed protein product [Lactuca virosa]|uniref:Uncharacterized protein n=1 Tax=Lactuca virosa TaxID=75947 RepID=A0AAU9PSA5_9ASTR|nr:unnamed protein product [Lactuca virosa]
MSSNHPSIRVRGQLSIPSTFIHRTSTEDDQSGDSRGKMKDGQQSKKRPKISLSAFLDRKLQKTSDSSKLVQGKERPFFTVGGANDSLDKANLDQKTEGPELNEESQIQDLTKSRNAFGGLLGKPPAPKGLVVLGGDPNPKQIKHRKPFIRNKKPLPHYNHYAGGSGWWDSDMEGIDNEAVGFNEVWEGVGSTTLGGLDWH